jgi:hypothetical protein
MAATLDNEEFPALDTAPPISTSHKKHGKAAVSWQWQSGALGPMDQNIPTSLPRQNGNDGHIATTSNQSRIKTFFANIIIRKNGPQ